MKSDQVLAVFRSFLNCDRAHAIDVMRQIVASEQQAGRSTVAARIRRLLNTEVRVMTRLPNAPEQIRFCQPEQGIEEVVLTPEAKAVVSSLSKEWQMRNRLQEHGLSPRSTMLLYGPSGNGKTLLAHAVASTLGLPLGVIDYGGLIGSYRGKTGENIKAAMSFARETPCVLFFDECDSLLCQRSGSDNSAGKEDIRSVTQVLLDLDSLGSRSLVIFASNLDSLLDSAFLRRIQICLEMPPPQNGQRERFVRSFAPRWPFLDYDAICRNVREAHSFAECAERVQDAARDAVIGVQPQQTKT